MNKTKTTALTATLMLAVVFIFSCSSSDDDGDGNDDGKSNGNEIESYKTVKIGEQTWMAENLNYEAEGSRCFKDNPANCAKYGRLYNWETAMVVCPAGWHLPSSEDWDILMGYVQADNGGNYTPGEIAYGAGKYLKATSGWNCYGIDNSEDKYGFAALPGGWIVSAGGSYNDENGYWWTASKDYTYDTSDFYLYMSMFCGIDYARGDNFTGKDTMLSVRCVQDISQQQGGSL